MQINCPHCLKKFVIQDLLKEDLVEFCPSCGKQLKKSLKNEVPFSKQKTLALEDTQSINQEISLIPGHEPEEETSLSIGPYRILRSIGKGGMGEVFLAYDTKCGRRIALKRIREDLLEHKQMHHRFLKEARVTSQLTHPAIIPIYMIQEDNGLAYYTMPFVEGETLKTILRDSSKLEKKGDKPHPIGGSIPPLIRIFLTICQAIAYAHSKQVLHRDLKPENIIVGKYGEVLILDWGLAKIMKKSAEEDHYPTIKNPLHHLTRIGKVVGTIGYMAPERALGTEATIQTDIYSLGVILYQMLTLKTPFKRGSLKEFRENMHQEELYNPIEVAPYRDVPKLLSSVVLKCLSKDIESRYKNVDELIHDIEMYLEGKSEWFEVAELQVSQKSDWEFQENVLMAEHIAITREAEVTDWVSLMISKQSFPQNIKIEAEVKIEDKCHGIGFLLSVPEKAERAHLNEGYCLWIGTEDNKSTKLLSGSLEVYHASDSYLKKGKSEKIRIEKIENNIHFYLDDQLQFSYISHNPLVGTHIGFISRDVNFTLSPLKCYSGSESIEVSCLAIPDAFLAHKDYKTALIEYRRIGYSFPGTTEGREALFRAGITLLEEAKCEKDKTKQQTYFELALKEFGHLHKTSGAPLEYLGKALVYEASGDDEEEIKCFELAYRRYPKHPLLHVLHEHVLYRMYESSLANRLSTYNFVLLAIRFLPNLISNPNSKKLFSSLKKNWEPLSFILEDPDEMNDEIVKRANLEIILSFWLAKPYVILETIDQLLEQKEIKGKESLFNAIFSLLVLGSKGLATKKLDEIKKCVVAPYDFELLEICFLATTSPLEPLFDRCFSLFPKDLTKKEMRVLDFILSMALNKNEIDLIIKVVSKIKQSFHFNENEKIQMDDYFISALLIKKDLESANELLKQYPFELLNQESTSLYFLYGCWLYMTEGKEIAKIHFSGALEVSFPRSYTLGAHYLNGDLKENGYWFKQAFLYEKRKLYQELCCFYKIRGDEIKESYFNELEQKEYLNLDD